MQLFLHIHVITRKEEVGTVGTDGSRDNMSEGMGVGTDGCRANMSKGMGVGTDGSRANMSEGMGAV